MKHSLGTAAKATGKAKSTISRDIRAGRLSATRKPDGSYEVDPSELHRVYPPVSPATGARHRSANDSQPAPATGMAELQARLEAAEERLRDKDGTIEDLRRRLDAADQERREVARQLTALLTDQRGSGARSSASSPRAPWWSRLFGRRA